MRSDDWCSNVMSFNPAFVDVLAMWYNRLYVVYKTVSKRKLEKSVNRSEDNIKRILKNGLPEC